MNNSSDNQNGSSQDSESNAMGLNRTANSSSNAAKRGNVRQTERGGSGAASMGKEEIGKWLDKMVNCNLFNGSWVRDDQHQLPMYEPGSCPYIDEPFDCFRNGRRDNGYERYRWQPKACNIPRWNGKDMLQLLRGKRLVYVGDSLNRNMWESMICMLRDSAEDKSKVYEASGRVEFRTEDSYSFLFTDYNCSVEFFQSPFLVQPWEVPDANGTKKETLRLDLVERKGYYQEGSHIYDELNVFEAFRKAMTTWARWIDANVDPMKTLVLFRGYSASHFSGGRWNSGGQCDNETEPIEDERFLSLDEYLPMLEMVERVLKGMKSPVFYLNITRMSDFRKDAHPSIYRKQNLTDEEKKSPLRFQDCSHWCLPGVPDTWNEIVYMQLLMRQNQQKKWQQQLKTQPQSNP
ncbi:hypothetical protein RJ640_023542 [Escallonia rubra]|uniref:Trichome birefringence-like N-terminal domain-containing protein n=1 Tax=Escallonia rubra TaxID=112253 RepID=A0AA88RJG7_9ASTE|nr:hypothetical protein RJ640_023542 [Escallonia rubra]